MEQLLQRCYGAFARKDGDANGRLGRGGRPLLRRRARADLARYISAQRG
jgi:hypothetical protein